MTTLNDIEAVLDRQVRPHLRSHGGELTSLSFEDGVYRFRFLGQCSGCPSADLTTQDVVAEALKTALPEIRDVILVREVSQDLLDQARAILEHRG